MSDDNRKNIAQTVLRAYAGRHPVGIYEHYKGGCYVLFSHTIDEETLVPLVHYYSLGKATRWTRTIANFTQVIDGRPRFIWQREATGLELATACSTL